MPEKTLETVHAYRHRVEQLTVRCARALRRPKPSLVTAVELVRWLLAERPDYSPNTWRQYKASVVFVLQGRTDVDSRQALQLLHDSRGTGGRRHSRRTSGTKAKSITPKDREKVLRWLSLRERPFANVTGMWLVAGIMTGARPCEWYEARLQHGVPGALSVTFRNAKATNGRANGPTRTLYFEGLADIEIQLLDLFVREVQATGSDSGFQRLYERCRRCMYKAARKALGKRRIYPTLYTGRHQFSADRKAEGLPLDIIAALMGHASDATATKHYGKARKGAGGRKVKPDAKEVATVRSRYRKRRKRRPGPR